MDEKQYYELQIIGVIKADNNSLITERVEVLYEENDELKWITLVTDVSATSNPQQKIIVDGITRDDIIKIQFDNLDELKTIKCIRITAMVFEVENRKLLHIVRKTIGVNFESSDKKIYRIGVYINFPFLMLENENTDDLIKRSLIDMKQCEMLKMLEYTRGIYVEYDEYEKKKHKEKIYIPIEKGNEIIEKCFPGIRKLMEMYQITRWNLVELEKVHECSAIDINPSDNKIEIDLL